MSFSRSSREPCNRQDERYEGNPEDDPIQPLDVAGLRPGGMKTVVLSGELREHQRETRSGENCGCDHFGDSGAPVIPVGVCLGMDCSGGLT